MIRDKIKLNPQTVKFVSLNKLFANADTPTEFRFVYFTNRKRKIMGISFCLCAFYVSPQDTENTKNPKYIADDLCKNYF